MKLHSDLLNEFMDRLGVFICFANLQIDQARLKYITTHIHTSWLSGKNFACVDHHQRLSNMFITAYTFFSYYSSSHLATLLLLFPESCLGKYLAQNELEQEIKCDKSSMRREVQQYRKDRAKMFSERERERERERESC